MTLTLPSPDAGDASRQRFALELLLQHPVPGPEQLLASRKLLSDAQLARDALDLEASLNDAKASPVVTLVDRILLLAMYLPMFTVFDQIQ